MLKDQGSELNQTLAIENQDKWSSVRDTQGFVGRIEFIVLSLVKLNITKKIVNRGLS